MAAQTVGFAVADDDRPMLDRLVERYGHGNRSEFLRVAMNLAAAVGAFIVVSDDTDLTSMSPWRGTPILRPHEFASRVDAMRRARRRQ